MFLVRVRKRLPTIPQAFLRAYHPIFGLHFFPVEFRPLARSGSLDRSKMLQSSLQDQQRCVSARLRAHGRCTQQHITSPQLRANRWRFPVEWVHRFPEPNSYPELHQLAARWWKYSPTSFVLCGLLSCSFSVSTFLFRGELGVAGMLGHIGFRPHTDFISKARGKIDPS